MTPSDYKNLLNNPESLSAQIGFCQELAKKWRENDDAKMANMYSAMAESLIALQTKMESESVTN